MAIEKQAYIAALKVEIFSLTARRKAAAGYVYNTDMKIECDILSKQLHELTAELAKEEQQ